MQLAGRDGRHLAANRLHRTESSADQPPHDPREQPCGERNRHRQRARQSRGTVFHVVKGSPDEQGHLLAGAGDATGQQTKRVVVDRGHLRREQCLGPLRRAQTQLGPGHVLACCEDRPIGGQHLDEGFVGAEPEPLG